MFQPESSRASCRNADTGMAAGRGPADCCRRVVQSWVVVAQEVWVLVHSRTKQPGQLLVHARVIVLLSGELRSHASTSSRTSKPPRQFFAGH